MANDRWSKNYEINRVLKDEAIACGPVLQRRHGKNMVYAGDGHTLFLGVSGKGKTWSGTIPLARSIIENHESLIVADSKGDIYHHTACYAKKQGYRIKVFNFRDLFNSDCFNPLAAIRENIRSRDPYKVQTGMEMLDELAHSLYPLPAHSDPFWTEAARTLFIGATAAVVECGTKDQVTLESVHHLISKGQERYTGSMATYLKAFIKELPEDSIAAKLLSDYTTTANDTAAGMRSSFDKGISFYCRSEALISLLGNDDLHLNDLDGETPTAIYIVMPDENSIYTKVVGNMVSQLLSHYTRIAHEKYDGALPRRLHFIIEEAGNIGEAIPDLDFAMTAARSRNIRIHIVLQSLSQLNTVFGDSKAQTITDNASVIVAFGLNHWPTLEELSRKCGEFEYISNGHQIREKVITPTELMAMQRGQALVIIEGRVKFITWLPGYDKMFDISDWAPPERVRRIKPYRPPLFRIDVYLQRINLGTEKKKEVSNLSDYIIHPENQSSNRPSAKTIPSHKLDEYIKKLDEKIAELEKQEQEERMKSQFKVILQSLGKDKMQVIALIKEHERCNLQSAFEYSEKLPFVMVFDTKEQEEKARKDFIVAGAEVE